MKIEDPDPEPNSDPGPFVRGMDQRIRIRIHSKMSWIRNTDMEVDFQSLFGLYVTRCAQLYSLAETRQPHPPTLGLLYEGAIGWSAKIDDISL
jgi:hypothetical protein